MVIYISRRRGGIDDNISANSYVLPTVSSASSQVLFIYVFIKGKREYGLVWHLPQKQLWSN